MQNNGNNDNYSELIDNLPDLPPLPEDLTYLLDPGIRYGVRYEFDDDMQWFVENAKEEEYDEVAGIAERARISGDYRRFIEWSNEIDHILERDLNSRLSSHTQQSTELKNVLTMKRITKANQKTHYMDIYFLFGLMDTCDLKFE